MRLSVAVLLVSCCLIEQIAARSLVKDLLILKFIANIIKPRFVPLPLPVPLPIKFTKHTHKAYPVPIHGHGFSGHQLDHSPLSFHLGGGYDGLFDHHDFSSYGHDDLSSLSYDHHGISALSSMAHDHHDLSAFSDSPASKGHYQLTSLPSLPPAGQLAVASIPSKYAAVSHLTAADRHIIQSLVDSAELTKVPSKKDLTAINEEFLHSSYDDSSEDHEDSSAKLQLSAANDEFLQNLAHASEISYDSSDLGDSTHHDIDAVGGFDFLTDLHDVGDSHDWWK